MVDPLRWALARAAIMTERTTRQAPAQTPQAPRASTFAARLQSSGPNSARALQRSIGNRAVQRLARQRLLPNGLSTAAGGSVLQRTLSISRPDAAQELEAERVADQLVAPADVNRQAEQLPHLARALQTPDLARPSGRSGNERDLGPGFLQRAEMASEGEAGSEFAQRLHASGGSRLAQPTRAFMEASFSAEFDGVRVHTDRQANQLAGAIQARAFTRGSDIFFAEGQYRPTTPAGQHLLAHELAHVVRQDNARPTPFAQTIAGFQASHPGSEISQLQRQVLDSSLSVRQRGGSAIMRSCFGDDKPSGTEPTEDKTNVDPDEAFTGVFKGSELTVTVNVTHVAGSSMRSASTAFDWANQHVYAPAKIRLTKGTERTLTEAESREALGERDYPRMTEYGSSNDLTDAHKRLYRYNQSQRGTTVYFVNALTMGSAGEALTPSSGHGFTGAEISDKGTSQTVAHELGHVLLNPGPHIPGKTGKNLMHPTDGEDKTELTVGQVALLRGSAFAEAPKGTNPFGDF